MGKLRYEDSATGVIYGFLKQIPHLQEMFNTERVVFCWDSIHSKRQKIFPNYKKKRTDRYKELDEDEVKFEKEFRYQMKQLRKIYLKKIGYRNVFMQKGYEGDDIMASICKRLPEYDSAILVTSDHDMYQCLQYNISIYNGTSFPIMTNQLFKKKFGLSSNDWCIVKALAGCSTDEVPGIKGVGEKTAIKYLKGELKPTSKIYKKMQTPESKKIYERNRKLVFLPMKGTKEFVLREDRISQKGWEEVVDALGMKSIKDKAPIWIKRNAIKKKKSKRKLL